MDPDTTTVAISGGGPAGVMLGLLLARQGVDVTVLEKHGDFLRDFRGDTVHPSTQVVLQQLGLLEEFDGVVRGRMHAVDFGTTDGPLVHQELAAIRPRFPFHEIALAPQWDLLDLLVRAGARYPGFHVRMEAETVGAIRTGSGAVRGVRYRKHGAEHELRAVLTVDAEGRHSGLREAIDARLIEYGAPIDVLWFRIAHAEGDPAELRGTIGRGGALIAVDRHDYWQVALVIAKGSSGEIYDAGLEAFKQRVTAIAPWMAERMDDITDFEQVKLLAVTIERLQRWWTHGLLAIGDAAHTMSPMGGVGINLAVADAVAAANMLGPVLLRAQADPLRFERTLNPSVLARVQRRRSPTAVITQGVQVVGHRRVIGLTRTPEGRSLTPPRAVRLLLNGPIARVIPRIFVFGLRPERIAAPVR